MRLLLTCVPGLEPFVEEEMRAFGKRARTLRQGRLETKGRRKDVVRLNLLARTVERVVVLLDVRNVGSLDEIYRAARDVPWEEWIPIDAPFAVRSERMGKHTFTSVDIAATVGQAVIDRFMEIHGRRPPVDLRHPKVIARADLDEEKLFLGVDTTGDRALHRRGWRRYVHPANLNPTIAQALIMASGWRERETLLDPMCGGGTIPIEAGLRAMNVPHSRWRRFAFEDLPAFSGLRVDVKTRNMDLSLFGSDLFEKHVRGARMNAESAGVDAHFFRHDARRIHELPFAPDVIVTNPPYGLRIANPRVVLRLYDEFARSASLAGVGRIVALSARWAELAESLEAAGYSVEKVRGVLYGRLHTAIIRAEK